ncbi:MAG: glycoside hydrolase family 71/99-like protein [Lentimicrobium sp.]|jgi:hypothetical protein|nr:glycoside hydrolase family 71/99-like protein [Lentimicrobium sp.]
MRNLQANLQMKFLLSLILLLNLSVSSCKKDDKPDTTEFKVTVLEPLPVEKTRTMQLFAHYMPWFEDKTTSDNGQWGWHWTMNNQNPDVMDANGKRQIASHYYPLIGPYASGDMDLIEYHLLLMKYSGIDGVLIDWYGKSDVFDYGSNRRNTEALIEKLDKVGLGFAIVYEDGTIPNVMAQTGSAEALSLAREDMRYIELNYFSKKSYIKVNGKPLLMVFGPRYFQQASDWEFIISIFNNKPCFMPLWGNSSATGEASSGEFIWVDMVDIDNKYATAANHDAFVGGAWPAFDDFYLEGGAGNNLFTIDDEDGALWQELLQKAAGYNMDYLQLITWNDFGEGTIIEPTQEFQYRYLEDLQDFAGLNYTKNELEKIKGQFELRKSFKDDKSSQKVLDQAFYYWVSLQNNKAIHLLDSLSAIKNY